MLHILDYLVAVVIEVVHVFASKSRLLIRHKQPHGPVSELNNCPYDAMRKQVITMK